ncbi:uncharacterized protein [Prorops nasuta]|uniref:uncharacterized protein n=1 Tax=Prorops nasuta TaxID=863751 RepID=UPI0034CE4CFC
MTFQQRDDEYEYDYYEILGCSTNSSHEDIKQAYRKLALKYHPDKNNMPDESIRHFQLITNAWKILGSNRTRKEYDAEREQARLDSISIPVYATISPCDLQPTTDSTLLKYPCRCGDYYYASVEDLKQADAIIHIPCSECTFVIAVKT